VLYEPPFDREDLAAPPLGEEELLRFLAAEKVRKFPAPAPFYQDLADGKLRLEDVQLWVKDMYSYWNHALVFSTGCIFVKTNDEETRTHILRKLVDIEGEDTVKDLTGWTTPSWEELWLRFGESSGLTRHDIEEWHPFTRSYFAQSTLILFSRWWEWSWLDGIASFLAGDLLMREHLQMAYDALLRFYDIPAAGLEFFRIAIGDLDSHIPWERATLAHWCFTTERQLTAAKAFRYRLEIEHALVARVHTAITTDQLPVQVP